MSIPTHLLLLGLAGGVGTLLRYGLTVAALRLLGSGFPWGTLAVNVIGSFLFGWIWSLAIERRVINDEWRVILLTGFLGGLTTFSSYAFDTTEAFRRNVLGLGVANVLVQNALGVAAVLFGIALGRWGAAPRALGSGLPPALAWTVSLTACACHPLNPFV